MGGKMVHCIGDYYKYFRTKRNYSAGNPAPRMGKRIQNGTKKTGNLHSISAQHQSGETKQTLGREHSKAYLGAGTERAGAGAGAGEGGDARGPGGSAPGASGDGGEGRPNGSRGEERLHQTSRTAFFSRSKSVGTK